MIAFGEQILKIEGNNQDLNIAKTNIESKATPNFANVATTKEGMFAAEDDYGTSYYYRGVADNNYVKFGDFYWRIVRITGEGSIKLIYQGSTPNATGSASGIGTGSFNTQSNNYKYVGYIYDSQVGSSISTRIDNWYITNIVNKGLHSFISDIGFCGDKTFTLSGSNYNYVAYNRNYVNKTPTFKCHIGYTVSNIMIDYELRYPVALLSADEVAMAGGKHSTSNTQYYLYSNVSNWLLSPARWVSSQAQVFFLNTTGSFSQSVVTTSSYSARPVIHLSKSKAFIESGDGTVNNPYIIKTT